MKIFIYASIGVCALGWASVGAQSVTPSAEPAQAIPARTIELAPAAGQDAAITARLQQIYAAMDGLGAVVVSTESGVVTLGGRVDSPRLRASAEGLATALEGVVAVENRLEQAAQVDDRVRSVWADLRGMAVALLKALPLWLTAFVIVLGCWFAGAALGRAAASRLRRARNPFVGELVRQGVRIALAVAGLMLALSLLDAAPLIGSVVGGLGLIGLALGFAVKDTLENYLASVLLSLRQPFRPDDLVAIDGREGRVLRVNSRATMLMDADGNHVRIPNAAVYKATIVNYDRNPARRFAFRIGVEHGAALARVLQIAETALGATPGVLASPAPLVFVDAFEDAKITIQCSGWVNQQHVDFGKTRSAAMIAIQAALAAEGIDTSPRLAVDFHRSEKRGPAPSEVEPALSMDVTRDDQTRVFRARDAGENLLAQDGRSE